MARKPFDFDRKRALGLNKRVQDKFEDSLQDKEETFNNEALLFYLKNAIADYSGSEVTMSSIDEGDHVAYNFTWPADEFVDNTVFVQVYDDGITGRVQFYFKKNKKTKYYQMMKRKFSSDDRHLNLNSVTINGILDLVKKHSSQYVKESSLGLNKHVQKKFNDVDAVDNISDYVDLGLPSGTLWCRHNYGADEEYDYGEYFKFDDAQELGADLPTGEDFVEMILCCNHEWTEVNGTKGMKFTSKQNGQSIFFPAAGNYLGPLRNYLDTVGNYWFSSTHQHGKRYYMHFNANNVSVHLEDKDFLSFSVRAVQKSLKETHLGLNKHVQKKFKAHGVEDYAEDIAHPVKYDTMYDVHQTFKKLIDEHLGQEIYTDHVDLNYIDKIFQGGPEFALYCADYYYREKNEKGRNEIFATIWIGVRDGIGIVYSVDNYIKDVEEYAFDPKEPIKATDLNVLKSVIKLKECHEFMKDLPD